MNSNFNKSLLWLVMLSTISQVYPMGTSAKMVSKIGVAAAFALPTAGYAYAFGRNANIRSAFAEQTPVSTEVVEAPVSTEVVETAKSIAQRAAAKVAQGKTVVINGYTSVKNFAVDKATDKEFLAQGFCGMVTLGSVYYLAHKTGVFVKIKNNWKRSLIGAGVVASVLAGAAYMYPETALNVAKSALNATTNPYTALAAGAAVAAYGAQSKFKNNYAKAGSAIAVAATAAGIGAANKFGYTDVAKNGVAYAATKVKEGAVWAAQQGYNYVAKPVYDYTVAPVVAQAVKHPYIAAATAATVAVPAVGYGVYKGYKAWNKPAKTQRRIAPVVQQSAQPKVAQQVRIVQAAPQQAPQGYFAQGKKAVTNKLNGVTAAKKALVTTLEQVVKSFKFAPGDEAEIQKHVNLLTTKGIEVDGLVKQFKINLTNYNNSPAGRTKTLLAAELNIILANIKSALQ